MDIKQTNKDTIAILGLGKVGTALGFLLRAAGYRVVAAASRTTASLDKGIVYTGGKAFTNYSEAAGLAKSVFITTTDDAISSICEKIVNDGSVKPGKKVIHMSGVGGLDLLVSARNAGAHVASIHPLQSFADVESAIRNIPGSAFGITAEDDIKAWSVQLVTDLGGMPFFVPDADKPLYHAAACIASNYLTTLVHTVEEIYQFLGLTRDDAFRAFWPLVKGTMSNIETSGTIQALTGPIARGDIGTVKKHLDALQVKMPLFLRVYSILGILTADIGIKKNTLTPETAKLLKELLEGGLEHEQASRNK